MDWLRYLLLQGFLGFKKKFMHADDFEALKNTLQQVAPANLSAPRPVDWTY
jgi:hypothetical protein